MLSYTALFAVCTEVEFLGDGWGGGGVNSHNRIKPNINCGCIELY